MARYVVLQHDHPVLHWDLMLQAGDVLRTWRLAEAPEDGRAVPAEMSFDHRLLYLEYEGPVGGGRGRVRCWQRGNYAGGAPDELEIGEKRTIDIERASGRAMLCFERVSELGWIVTMSPAE